MSDDAATGVDLYWIPLGAGVGGAVVRHSGRIYETAAAAVARRPACDLYHSALILQLDGTRTAVEMAPIWTGPGGVGIVAQGPVGTRLLGHWSLFRYGVRRWTGGTVPDLAAAVDGPRRLTDDPDVTTTVFDLVPTFPTATWGRDELRTGDMWNSNSLVSWLIASARLGVDHLGPPDGGRAPGWSAGIVAARRADPRP